MRVELRGDAEKGAEAKAKGKMMVGLREMAKNRAEAKAKVEHDGWAEGRG